MEIPESKARLELRARVEDRLAVGEVAERAKRLLESTEMGHLATAAEGWPYVLPLAFAYDGAVIYFHCGEGLMASLLAEESRACLGLTTSPRFVAGPNPCEHSYRYESVLVFGEVTRLDEDSAREHALRLLLAKYHPQSAHEPFLADRFAGVVAYMLSIDALTYKRSPEE